MKRSKPLKRKTPLRAKKGLSRPTKPMAKQSKKRRKENQEYLRLREEHLKAHPTCEACLQAGEKPPRASTQIHHKARRQGKLLTDTRFFLAVCSQCHNKIEAHGDWAREQGFLLTPEQRRLLSP